jgi:predicted hydrocarbon binding protein
LPQIKGLAVEYPVKNAIPLSGYYWPTRIGRILLASLEAVIGPNGLNALLNLTGVGAHSLGASIKEVPPNDLARTFDFACVANLNQGLEMIYGPRGGRGLALRCGRVMGDHLLNEFGLLTGVSDLAIKLLPLSTKLRIGVPAVARIFTQYSDQTGRVEDRDGYFQYTVEHCPICWGRKTQQPVCQMTIGILQETLRVFSRGMEFRVSQEACRAVGAKACVFRIEKEPIR